METPKSLADKLGFPEHDIVMTLRNARTKLCDYREHERPRPSLDDKIISGWNGLVISSLARASAALSESDPQASSSWLVAATKAAEFVRHSGMWDSKFGILWRVYGGTTRGLADDYAAIVQGTLELYEATLEESWLQWADEVMAAQIRDFTAPEGGFYTAPNPSGTISDLFLHLKPGMDTAEPSANGLSAVNLFRLASLLDDENYANLARRTVAAFEAEIEQWPESFPGLLTAVAWGCVGRETIWIVGGEDDVGENPSGDQGKSQDTTDQENPTSAPGSTQEAPTLRTPANASPGEQSLTVSAALSHLRAGAKTGRTVLRIREGPSWLKDRNKRVGSLEVRKGDKVRVMTCERGVCREVKHLDEL